MKRHSIPPAPFFRPRLRDALIELNSTGARPRPIGGVTAVRMRLGSARREPAQGSHHACADAAGSAEPARDTPAQKRVAQGRRRGSFAGSAILC